MARQRRQNGESSTAVAEMSAIEIPPLVDLPDAVYCPHHVELQLSGVLARKLKRLQMTLELEGETTAAGRPVNAPQRALMWLLDRV